MAEQNRQNSESESGDPNDVEPADDTGKKDTSAATSRTWTILAIVSVAIFIVIAALLVIYLLQDRSQPEDVATETPPVVQGTDDVWNAIEEQGKIIVGTSADYPPFEYYDREFQLDGLDIAIIREIGRRLGLEVELRDMAFDGLFNALQINQIDAAISAITITAERHQVIDFSDTYYVSADALLAKQDAPFETIAGPDDASGLRVGVERGTIFESWAETELVEAGVITADDVFEYERIDDAITDLRAARIDLVALDLQPAQLAAESGGLKVVARGLNQDNFGIAVPNGASELLARLNQTLQAMEEDGTLRALSAQYTGLSEEAIQPLPPDEPTPGPDIGQAPGGCIDSAEHVSDLSFDDQNLTDFPELSPGETFQKGWRMRNSGTCTWSTGYALAPSAGDRMGGNLSLVETPVEPGGEYEFWVDLVAPIAPGEYAGYWSMRNDQSGILFGDRVSVAIEVVPAPEPTALPTQTPVPGISFGANPQAIQQGQCTTLSWNTQNVQAVYLYEQGEDWQSNPVAENGTVIACPPVTTTYELRVVMIDGRAETRQVTVSVTPNTSVPQITRFTVDPPDQIAGGQCVTIQWTVEGAVNSVNIGRGGVILWSNAPYDGSLQDCPPSLGQVSYTIVASGSGGASQAAWTINVVNPSTPVPTSTATAAPGTPTPSNEPVIYYFQAQPTTIPRNSCVTLSWSVGGNATRLRLLRNSVTIQDGLPFRSSWNDCSNSSVGTVIYLLVAQSNFNQAATSQVVVTVTP